MNYEKEEDEEIVEGEFKDSTNKEAEEKQYKNKVVFLRKSIVGNHLYAFDNDGAFAEAIEGSIIMNIAEVKGLLTGNFDFIKVSIMPKKEH
jgi:phage gp36-like protein